MNLTALGYAEIASYEGCCLRPYIDSAGIWTCFIGHTCAAGKPDPLALPRKEDQPMDDVLATFIRDMADVEESVTGLVRVPLQPHQFDALCSFEFNLGSGALASSTLLRKLNAGDFAGAVGEFHKWNHDRDPVTGALVEVAGLTKRRAAEERLFSEGTYASGGMCNLFPVSANGSPLYGQGREINIASLIEAMGTIP